jgi:hypothetical protein
MEFLKFILALFRGQKSLADINVIEMFRPALITLGSASVAIGLLYSYIGAISFWNDKLDWKDFFIGLLKNIPLVAVSFAIVVGFLFLFFTVLKIDKDWKFFAVHTAIMFLAVLPFLLLALIFSSNVTLSVVFGQVSSIVPFLYLFWFLSNEREIAIIKVFWGVVSLSILMSATFNLLGVNPFSITTINTIKTILGNIF